MIEQFDTLLQIGKVHTLGDGEAVFHVGQKANAIYRVLKGEVHLFRHCRDGKRILLFRAYDGDYFAEASLDAKHYHCTAICAAPTKLLVIDAKEMKKLLTENSAFALAWISRLSIELRQQRASVERLNLKSATDRVTHYLLTEGNTAGELHLKGTLTEMAEILGLSRESLYRTLAKMQEQGLLEREKNILRLKV